MSSRSAACSSSANSLRPRAIRVAAALLSAALLLLSSAGGARAQFHLQEATIDGIHAELRAGQLTCVQLVRSYLARIAAYDQRGPKLNAIQNINPAALDAAAKLDESFRMTGEFAGPLHCIPVLVKDDLNTRLMPTTYGSALFKHFIPANQAAVIDRLERAGAIILAKTNMGEFAQGYSGSAFGDCHNAYDPRRSPSGSSCGTGVGIAANFAAVGIGEDTLGSIRGPASHGSLVGLRPTLPLVSRVGVMPLAPTRDTIGPMTRTVKDAALVLNVIAGEDPADPVTAESIGHVPPDYAAFLQPNGLKGMRFGVIRVPMSRDTDTSAPDYHEVQDAVTAAVAVLQQRGAEVVDPLDIPGLVEMLSATGGGGGAETEAAVNSFLAAEPDAPAQTLRDIVASRLVNQKRRAELRRSLGHSTQEPAYVAQQQARDALRALISQIMDENHFDALIYATYDHAPAEVPKSTPGTNRVLAPALGFPAMSIPGGFFHDGLPIGLEFLARPYDEGTLFRAAYDFEQTTHFRHPPDTTPPLPSEP